ncbi:O-antigen translocase [Tunturiibacter gelidoferens]|uniref:PST family polysaccharide transporter n=1 Tax=Tunturiibacter gelidiferens TaxID=3069689 RepID=A0A9X0QGE5_9BACT|nr:O-antigen translocase [Edaphobacter lichenicola]MBB5329943.1 PST family polysaccharide transporter [Edaphobacter lichenicola]
MQASFSSAEPSNTAVERRPDEAAKGERNTYRQILKSSALVGGSQVLNIAIGIVRTKAMAILLGPSGFGLFALYGSISDLTQSIAGMGVNSSGVRQIAEAAGSANEELIARTATTLRRTSILLGILGAGFLLIFARQVSILTFGNDRHGMAISLLSVAVFLRLVSAGQGALIQGMRRISDLVKMSVLGALFGTLIGIPVVYLFRERGVVPSLVGVAAMTFVTSYFYSRKIHIRRVSITVFQVGQEVAPLLKLGFAFMVTGLMTMGSAYLVRIVVLRQLGLEAMGLYQSAWTLGGLYVSFILQAMGADFYPRLTACADDDDACNRIVNEQARVGLLLAGPGAILTLTLAPIVISLFYSAKFHPAVGILRWICLGTIIQVITWPIGFISLAKCRSSVFFWSDFAWAVVYLGLAWICVRWFGLNGTGIAFFGSYMFHALIAYPIARRLSGFRWSRENMMAGLILLSLIAVVFGGFFVLPFYWAVCLGALATVLSGAYSVRILLMLISSDRIPPHLQRFVHRSNSAAA